MKANLLVLVFCLSLQALAMEEEWQGQEDANEQKRNLENILDELKERAKDVKSAGSKYDLNKNYFKFLVVEGKLQNYMDTIVLNKQKIFDDVSLQNAQLTANRLEESIHQHGKARKNSFFIEPFSFPNNNS